MTGAELAVMQLDKCGRSKPNLRPNIVHTSLYGVILAGSAVIEPSQNRNMDF